MMNRYGLLGNNIAYSLSPTIHNAIIDSLSFDGSYDLLDITANQIPHYMELLKSDRTDKYDGYNITIPYKQQVIPYLQRLSPAAASTGAVNTIYYDGNELVGDNTDMMGFINSLPELQTDAHHKSAVILGSGATSNTIYQALDQIGYDDIIRVSRQQSINDPKTISYHELWQLTHRTLLVSTLPQSAYRTKTADYITPNVLSKFSYIYDLSYTPAITNLMTDANKLSIPNQNGLDMLINQAILSEEIWWNQSINLDSSILYRALHTAHKL